MVSVILGGHADVCSSANFSDQFVLNLLFDYIKWGRYRSSTTHSKGHHQRKMAAPVSRIFWLNLCTVEVNRDESSILFTVYVQTPMLVRGSG